MTLERCRGVLRCIVVVVVVVVVHDDNLIFSNQKNNTGDREKNEK